jgi:hypothetical protein
MALTDEDAASSLLVNPALVLVCVGGLPSGDRAA